MLRSVGGSINCQNRWGGREGMKRGIRGGVFNADWKNAIGRARQEGGMGALAFLLQYFSQTIEVLLGYGKRGLFMYWQLLQQFYDKRKVHIPVLIYIYIYIYVLIFIHIYVSFMLFYPLLFLYSFFYTSTPVDVSIISNIAQSAQK